MDVKGMLDIVVAGNENRRAHNMGRCGECWVAEVRDIGVMVLCSEARDFVPDELGL